MTPAPQARATGGRGVEHVKELIGGGLPLALGAPHHGALAMIADQREVAMALAPRDLIQRDLKQVVEPIGREQLVADPLDDPPDRLPIDPH